MTEARLIDGTPENKSYRKQLEATAKSQKVEKARADVLYAEWKERMDAKPVYTVEFITIDGMVAKRVGGASCYAIAATNRKSSRNWIVFEDGNNKPLCFLNKGEVDRWLISNAKNSND